MSLFGAAPPSFSFGAPAAAPVPSLFGGAPPTTPAAAPAFNLFGAAKPTPPAGGGLFGAAQPAAAPPKFSFGAPATPTGAAPSLFGQPAAGGGLFGGSPAPAAGGLFGAPPATPGLFGAQAQAPSAGLFGSAPGAPKSLFGQSAPPSSAPVGNIPAVTKHTKFNDAPDQYRSLIESIDGFIKSQTQLAEDLKTRDLGGDITKTSDSFKQSSIDFTTVSNQLSQDSRTTAELRQKLEVDLDDLSKATTMIEGFKNPQAKGAAAKVVANFPYEYFSRRAAEFKERIERYRNTMEQIHHQVSSNSDLERNPSAILPTLRAQHSSFMALASSVASLDSDLKSLREDYRAIWKEKTGSAQDPFVVGRNRGEGSVESGIQGIALR